MALLLDKSEIRGCGKAGLTTCVWMGLQERLTLCCPGFRRSDLLVLKTILIKESLPALKGMPRVVVQVKKVS